MSFTTAKGVLEIAMARGFLVLVNPGPPPMPVLRRPPNVKASEATPALLDALRAWRLEIIEELKGVEWKQPSGTHRIVVLKDDLDDGEIEEVVPGEATRDNLKAACLERPNRQLALEHLMRDDDGEHWIRFGWMSWPKSEDPKYH